MKLMIKQKPFILTPYFTVRDEEGNDRFFVKGEKDIAHKDLHICHMDGREILFLKKDFPDPWSFSVLQKGNLVARIREKVPKIGFRHFDIEGPGWICVGSGAFTFDVKFEDQVIAIIKKSPNPLADHYELTYEDERIVPMVIAIILAIDVQVGNVKSGNGS